MHGSAVRAAALLPVRLFFGATFVVAGLVKLLDPAFLDASSPASIQAQLAAFTRFSPLAGAIRWAEPWAVPIGVGIALAEVAVGLGALSGIAIRAAALGGAALSLLFFLTASWATRPFFVGADLPYAAGWAALMLAGDGGMRLRWPRGETAFSPSRRVFLETATLGVASLVLGSAATSARLLGWTGPALATGDGPSPAPVPPGSLTVASVADLEERRVATFRIPIDAPAPLPAGDPGVILHLPDGRFVAYDLVCTHAACTVGFNADSRLLECPCHGATYDPADGARVLSGPTTQPLAGLPLRVDPATGAISLAADS